MGSKSEKLVCFSATASFTLGAGLALVGVATLRNNTDRNHLPLLAFPLLFSGQQIAEGFVWLEMARGANGPWMVFVTHMFLVFAHVVWPALVPWALYLVEEDEKRKKIIRAIVPVGLVLSSGLLIKMFIAPYQAYVVGRSIRYESAFDVSLPLIMLYAIAVVGPLLLSSRHLLVVFGGLIVLSLLITNEIYAHAYISVWCFFAAVMCGIIFLYSLKVRQESKAKTADNIANG